jgi:hypothetical protein
LKLEFYYFEGYF